MAKKEEIDPVEMNEFDGGGWLGWYAKGHHDPADFCEAVAWAFGPDEGFTKAFQEAARERIETYARAEDVKHIWFRCVPYMGIEGVTILHRAREGRPGAFPVTVIEV